MGSKYSLLMKFGQFISYYKRINFIKKFYKNCSLKTSSRTYLPTNADVLKTLQNSTIETPPNNPPEIHFSENDSCVVAWYLGVKGQWFLGYIKEKGRR